MGDPQPSPYGARALRGRFRDLTGMGGPLQPRQNHSVPLRACVMRVRVSCLLKIKSGPVGDHGGLHRRPTGACGLI